MKSLGRTNMSKRSGVKRLSLSLGQRLEVEYSLTPETKEIAADVEVDRVLAYNGAVCVDIAPMLRANVPSLLDELADRCRQAENLGPEIPY
jgi:hypothetical protein